MAEPERRSWQERVARDRAAPHGASWTERIQAERGRPVTDLARERRIDQPAGKEQTRIHRSGPAPDLAEKRAYLQRLQQARGAKPEQTQVQRPDAPAPRR